MKSLTIKTFIYNGLMLIIIAIVIRGLGGGPLETIIKTLYPCPMDFPLAFMVGLILIAIVHLATILAIPLPNLFGLIVGLMTVLQPEPFRQNPRISQIIQIVAVLLITLTIIQIIFMPLPIGDILPTSVTLEGFKIIRNNGQEEIIRVQGTISVAPGELLRIRPILDPPTNDLKCKWVSSVGTVHNSTKCDITYSSPTHGGWDNISLQIEPPCPKEVYIFAPINLRIQSN